MERLTDIFNNPLTPWIIASVLVGGTFAVALRWWWHGRFLKLQVDQIRGASGVSTAFSIRGEAERWNDYAREKFETAKEDLLPLEESEPLARQTLAYLKRCEPVQEEGSDRLRLETAVAPAEVIRLSEHLMERDVQVSLYRAFPNYLVGVGLCITFLGLAVVIGKSSKVLQNSNTEAAASSAEKAAIKSASPEPAKEPEKNSTDKELSGLLVAASSKFWSSLAAVSCSILYGVWFRNRSQQMERVVGLLARDLGRCVRVISTDELHYESVRLLRICEEYQASTATKIGMVVTGLNNTQNSSERQHGELLKRLSTVAHSLEDVFTNAGAKIGTGFAKEVREAANHMRNITEEFKILTGNIKEQSQGIAVNFGQASGSAKNIETSFKELPSLADPLKQAALLLHHGAELVSSNISKIIQENENVALRWQALADLVKSVDATLAREIASLNGVFPPYAKELKKFSEELQAAMVTAVGGLAANIKDLSSSHEELRTQRTAWHDSAISVVQSVDAVNKHVTSFTAALAAHGEAQKLAHQSAIIANDPSPHGTQDLVIDAEKTSSSEPISNTPPA